MIRVTEVLNYFKEPWYIDWVHKVGRMEANKISKAAMKVGSRVDELIKANRTPTPKDKPEVHSCIAAFNKWKAIYQPKAITPYSRLYATIEGVEVTGEPDIDVDGVLVDIKCSSKISLGYWVQVNIYRFIEAKITLPKVGILRLDKVTGSFEYVVKDYDKTLVDVWVGLMRAYVYFKGEQNDGDEL